MVMLFMRARLVATRDLRFSIPDRSGHLLRDARRHAGHRARLVAPVGARRHADELREARAEGAERRAADRETDLGAAEVAATQQPHRALDPPCHEVAVRRLAEGELELAAEVPRRHVRAAGERLDVQRLRVLAVDPVAYAAQPCEVLQVLICCGAVQSISSALIGGSCLGSTLVTRALIGDPRSASPPPRANACVNAMASPTPGSSSAS